MSIASFHTHFKQLTSMTPVLLRGGPSSHDNRLMTSRGAS